MRACPSGITNGLFLGGCFALANPAPSGTNTTPRAVDCRLFCFDGVGQGEGSPAAWSKLWQMMGLLMRMLLTYFMMGRDVVLNLGFSDLRALIEMKKVRLFACVVIKK
jgi:hypothetical protein